MSDKEDWKVGDRVQKDAEGVFLLGTVSSLIMETREESVYNSVYYSRSASPKTKMVTVVDSITVKWDNGTEETDSTYKFTPEDSKMEREFRLAVNAAKEEIYKHVKDASEALNRAVAVSEKHGIPFNTYISFLSQTYVPTTFTSKYSEVDKSFAAAIANAYSEYGYDGGGWEHSQVC